MTGEALSVAMFFGVVGVLMLGFPVAFTLAGTSLIIAGIGWQFDAFNPALFRLKPPRGFGRSASPAGCRMRPAQTHTESKALGQ